MDKKLMIKILTILLVIFMGIIIFAEPIEAKASPHSTNVILSFPEGLEIIPSPLQTLKINEDYRINFFLYNTTNGLLVDNSSTNCTFYMADYNGELIVSGNFDYTEYWDYQILGGNFSSLGVYQYGISCQADNNGGAYVGSFEVTYTGKNLSESQSILNGFLFLILFGFMFVLFFIIKTLPSSNTKDEEGKILSISYLKYLRATFWFVEWMLVVGVLYIASNLAFAYLTDTLFADVLFVIFRISFGVTPVIVIVWIAWIFVKMFHDKQLQRLLNRGFFPQGRI